MDCSKRLVVGITLLVLGLCSQLSLTVSTAIQSGDSTSDQCGVFGWTVPSPPEDAKLVQVHTVIRHGDRTPWTGDYCWPKDSSVWNCYLNPAEIPMYSNTQYGQVVPRVYRKVYKYGVEELSGNCSVGQLTLIGFYQQIANGQSLRKAYVDSGFLSNMITPSEIYFRSDDMPRTRESGEALLLGMFPSNGSCTEVIDLNTMDPFYDYITPNGELCPKFTDYQVLFKTSKTWMDHWNITKSVLNDISTAINFTVDEDDLDHFVDCLTTHYCHNLSWPEGMTKNLYNEAWTEFSWQVYQMLKYPSVQENAQVGIGFLLKELWQQMNATVKGEPTQKFFLYSGHDLTLIPILVALQLDDGIWTPYGSMILMELYSVSSGSGYSVRIIYNGQVLKMPFCGSATLCDYKTFSEYMATVTPSDPAKQCLMKQNWKF